MTRSKYCFTKARMVLTFFSTIHVVCIYLSKYTGNKMRCFVASCEECQTGLEEISANYFAFSNHFETYVSRQIQQWTKTLPGWILLLCSPKDLKRKRSYCFQRQDLNSGCKAWKHEISLQSEWRKTNFNCIDVEICGCVQSSKVCHYECQTKLHMQVATPHPEMANNYWEANVTGHCFFGTFLDTHVLKPSQNATWHKSGEKYVKYVNYRKETRPASLWHHHLSLIDHFPCFFFWIDLVCHWLFTFSFMVDLHLPVWAKN